MRQLVNLIIVIQKKNTTLPFFLLYIQNTRSIMSLSTGRHFPAVDEVFPCLHCQMFAVCCLFGRASY
jgi:hypothetical protein